MSIKNVIVSLGAAAAASAAFTTSASAAEYLFKDGKSDWKIVLPTMPQRVEAYAAGELQSTLKAISGAELPIVLTDTLPERRAIILGSIDSPLEAVRKVARQMGCVKSKDDLVGMRTHNGNLYLVANSPRAVLYPVYHFLKAELGARWFWPGEDGTYLPKLDAYELGELDWRHHPSFTFRELSQCSHHGHLPTEHWMAKQGLNMGSQNSLTSFLYIRRAGTHTIGINKEHFQEHPDWFALVDGKRREDGVSGCWSNPGFTQAMVNRLISISKDAEILNAFPYDVCQRCECPDCTRLEDPSSRWYEYYNKLLTEVRKVFPNLRAAGIAYQEYGNVPELPVKGLEYIEYCQYDRCYIHKLDDPNCPVNQKSMRVLNAWREKATMGVYGYHFDIFNNVRMTPFWNMLADEARTYARLGLVRMKTEMPIRRPKDARREEMMHISQRLCYYIYAALTWDANTDVDALIDDWCRYLFGAGAAPMNEYLKRFAADWDRMKSHISYFGSKPEGLAGDLMSQELVDFAHGRFAAAEAAVRAQPETGATRRQLAEIATERALFAQWEESWAEARKHDVSYKVPKFPAGTSFDKVPQIKVTGAKGTFQPTEMRLYATDEALHIQVVAFEKEMDKIRRGATGRDVPFWNSDNIEIFLGVGDGLYKQLGVNFAGGTYEANGQDSSWNVEWTATTKAGDDRWTAEITLPFKSFGGEKHAPGAYWRRSVIRNTGRQEACCFPAAIYRDLSLMAKIYFE